MVSSEFDFNLYELKEIDDKIGTLRKDKKTATDSKNQLKKELEKIDLNNKELEKMKMAS